jgi:hypothetical protein
VVAKSFSTDEGAFLKGQITMEEQIDLGFGVEDQDGQQSAELDDDEGD